MTSFHNLHLQVILGRVDIAPSDVRTRFGFFPTCDASAHVWHQYSGAIRNSDSHEFITIAVHRPNISEMYSHSEAQSSDAMRFRGIYFNKREHVASVQDSHAWFCTRSPASCHAYCHIWKAYYNLRWYWVFPIPWLIWGHPHFLQSPPLQSLHTTYFWTCPAK